MSTLPPAVEKSQEQVLASLEAYHAKVVATAGARTAAAIAAGALPPVAPAPAGFAATELADLRFAQEQLNLDVRRSGAIAWAAAQDVAEDQPHPIDVVESTFEFQQKLLDRYRAFTIDLIEATAAPEPVVVETAEVEVTEADEAAIDLPGIHQA